jgi:hypothetical protein
MKPSAAAALAASETAGARPPIGERLFDPGQTEPAASVLFLVLQPVAYRSANIPVTFDPPMAVHTVADEHDTLPRLLDVAPAGLGVVWSDQRFPFQRSANMWLPLVVL